ncbi:MAG: ACT domain-containing protein [Candidatus Auribacterota bacterium]|jgi:glycine cleavage system transcriptional repressor|nr:ACT domain-containing protein [Candidatus Auribacterota bacterium]
MKQIVALTALGLDRPGIVAAVTKVLYESGCNLEESSMTLLHNDFAMIVLISMPDTTTLEKLKNAIQPVAHEMGLSVNFRTLSEREISDHNQESLPNYSLSIYGTDKPGIVYRITSLLAKHKINIIDLETQCTRSRQPLYSMVLDITVPESLGEEFLSRMLAELCNEIKVDFSLEPITFCEEM